VAVRPGLHRRSNTPAPGVGIVQALLVEALVTFVLVFVVVSVATDERVGAAVAPIAVGFALTVAVLIAGPVTGGAVNPARALGPMLVSGKLDRFWIYILGPILGPILGAVIAALAYDRFLAKGSVPE